MNQNQGEQNREWFYEPPKDASAQSSQTYQSGPAFYQEPVKTDSKGSSSQIFGILSLVSLVFCQLLSVIFGVIAMVQSKTSRKALGAECGEARVGRICGLIGLIIGAISVLFTVAIIAFAVIMLIIASMAV